MSMTAAENWQGPECLYTENDDIDKCIERNIAELATKVLRLAIHDYRKNTIKTPPESRFTRTSRPDSARTFFFSKDRDTERLRKFWCDAAGIDESWLLKKLREGCANG